MFRSLIQPMWLTALALELADESKGQGKSRALAGILLRGCLVGRVRAILGAPPSFASCCLGWLLSVAHISYFPLHLISSVRIPALSSALLTPMILKLALGCPLPDLSLGSCESLCVSSLSLRISVPSWLLVQEDERKDYVLHRWQSVPLPARTEIKNRLWDTMKSADKSFRHRAAEAVAQIAILDLPTDAWKGVIGQLSEGVTNEASPDEFKEACLIALSEICVGSSPNTLMAHSFDILLAIITGMGSPHVELQLVATKALANAIEFSEKNFSNPEQRASIMTLVVKMTTNEDEEVRIATYECLVNIAAAYYVYLPDHMNELYDATLNAIKTDECDHVVQQAIEFWSTICEEETNIFLENKSALDTGAEPMVCHNFIQGAIAQLAQPLFQSLSRGDVDPELETWTVSSAAASCISLIATTLGNDVVDHFVPFVSASINDPEERVREAAVLCFGSIMDGPGTDAIGAIIYEALPVLFERLVDQSQLVKHTTAWCLAKIAQFHPAAITEHLEVFLHTVCNSLQDIPSIAAVCADTIEYLASHIHQEDSAKSPLNPYLADLFNALIAAGDRPDADTASLRIATFSAVRSLVKATPDANIELIDLVLNTFAPRLRESLGGVADAELQGELCGITAACTRRLGEAIGENADNLMELYISLLEARNGVSSIFQEVFMAASAISDVVGAAFIKYMDAFGQYLLIGLNQWQDAELCSQSIQLVSALCFSLGPDFAPYCADIIKIFLQHLDQPDLPEELGPIIVNAFSDIAFVLEGEFATYLTPIMDVLLRFQPYACKRTETEIEWEKIEKINHWRSAILVVYTLILQSCGADHAAAIQPHVSSMTRLLSYIADDRRREDIVNRYACGLIYDIAATYPNRVDSLHRYDPFLEYCRQSSQSEVRTRDAAQNAIDKLNP